MVQTLGARQGPWSELDASYRLPNKILRYATSFAKTFLPIENCLPPKPDPKQSELELYPCELKWLQIQRNDSVDACVEELFKLIREDENGDRAIPDLTLLTDNKDDGASIVQKLMNLGVNVVHTFARPKSGEQRQWNEDRRKKLGFWKGDARIKLTTLHSFKGWEGRLIVLNITHAKSRQDFALIYTGLTRLKRHVLGSCMTVVCSEPTLAEFGAQWRHSS